MSSTNTPSALLGAVAGLLTVFALQAGVNLSAEVASAIVLIVAVIISYANPRWAKSRGIFVRRPAAWSGAAATLLVFLAPLADIDLSPETATILVATVIGLVGGATPVQEPKPQV